MKARHCIVEVRSMCKSCLVCFLYAIIFGFRMRNSSYNALRLQITCKVKCSGQFGRSVPTLDAIGAFKQRGVFCHIDFFHLVCKLFSRHLTVQVRAFHMQAEYRAIGFGHQFFAYIYSFAYFGERRRRKCRKKAGGTVLHVCSYRRTESLFGTFRKIVSSPTMGMHTNKAGNNIHSSGIHQIGTDQRQVAISYFQNFSISHQHRTFVQPTMRSKYASIDNLSQHDKLQY